MFSQQANSNLKIGETGTLNGYFQGAPTCSSIPGKLEWKAAYTRQHHEKSVALHLAGLGMECFLPLYIEEHHWSNNRRPTLELPLFPNYLFVRVSPQSRIRVLKTPGVIDIVGRNSITDRITDEEIEILRSGLPMRKPKPHPFALGESVRIVRGPLSTLEGVVIRQKGALRVVITVPLIQQSVSVEIAADELESVHQISTC